jgi:hypothetical protein
MGPVWSVSNALSVHWRGVRDLSQVEKVCAFDVVELQRPSNRVEDTAGDAGEVPLLQARVFGLVAWAVAQAARPLRPESRPID